MKISPSAGFTIIAAALLVAPVQAPTQQRGAMGGPGMGGPGMGGPGGGFPSFALEDQRREPFRIFDNLYYVGVDFVSSFLLTTSDGLILMDALFADEGYAEYLLENVREVGFDPADIKYVLITHGHPDHFGAAAAIQAATGAQVGTTAADWDMIEAQQGNAAPRRDRVFADGDTLTLGDTTLRFHVTPGHTPGVLSMEFPVFDGARQYKAFAFNGAGLGRGPSVELINAYIESIERVRGISGIEVNIVNHPFLWDVFGRAERLANRAPGDPHPFVAPEEIQEWLDGLSEQAHRALAEATGN